MWREDGPVSRERAREAHRTLRETAPSPARDGGLARLAEELPGHVTTFPGAALVTMTPEEMDQVSNHAFAAARALGLVCYDPQRDLVHNLGPLGVHPGMQLHTGDGMVVVDPDLGLVHDVLGTLSPANPFAALVVFGSHFIQVSPGDEPEYELEYKEGVLRRATVAELAEVRRAFAEYATGERAFLGRHSWSPVTS